MAITNGPNLNSVAASQQQALASNYLDLASTANEGWAQQYVPDLMEKEAEVFGPRTISGFLSQVGAEEAMTADQVVWSEQSRLHLSYKVTMDVDGGLTGGNGGLVTVVSDIDGNIAADGFTPADHGVRVNDTVLLSSNNTVIKALVTEVHATNATFEVEPYGAANCTGLSETAGATTCLVYGSEFGKGMSYNSAAAAATDQRGANEPTFKSFSNKPIILKDYYEVSGSDASRIGWVEIASEGGASGYLWYLKAESDTRARFGDYLEMSMLEAELSVTGTDEVDDFLSANGNPHGSEGLFAAITDRGNVSSDITAAGTALGDFDSILAEFDRQGAIEEYMLFLNRSTNLIIDDMLALMNSYGTGGTSYGVFENDEDMALNLGFTGFRRGSYDFYKSDFRYLNDKATRGGINDTAGTAAIRGVFIPAGTSNVYDQMLGRNIKRPFLHVRYRASQTDDRRMKSWVTGSVGAATSALDAMQIHMLSERCLITQGANNFMLLQ